ncbi:diacylglycerol kinase epsilon isoform X2 [Hypanus sabinus]|uniref:diacylglycerol kinase epsilon isoform X2 n=1 Tax=Hypanus sabinus TaxID=79690 RepID=UPI0028C3AE26|nr:diacylglycerol kinase epsilon isoform X2 [Hypanus sabinus]
MMLEGSLSIAPAHKWTYPYDNKVDFEKPGVGTIVAMSVRTAPALSNDPSRPRPQQRQFRDPASFPRRQLWLQWRVPVFCSHRSASLLARPRWWSPGAPGLMGGGMGEGGGAAAEVGPGAWEWGWSLGAGRLALLTAAAVLLPVLLSWWYGGRRGRPGAPAGPGPGGHCWLYSDLFGRPTYCSECGQAALRGCYCDSCGACVHTACQAAAERRLLCKQRLSAARGPPRHHWLRGNLPLCNRCAVCGLQCGSRPCLCDQRCIWCQQVAHDDCLARVPPTCPLGPLPRAVVPPQYLHWVSHRTREPTDPAQYISTSVENWSPVLVLGNSRSGNNMAQSLMGEFRTILNPVQVLDLGTVTPYKALQLCTVLPSHSVCVLVCGGDGTVGWVLDAIDEMKHKGQEQYTPRVAILPLGTGNDLSRTLGWGAGYTGDQTAEGILRHVLEGETVKLDRWRVRITKGFYSFHRLKVFSMNNYFSIGPDALMALNFHEHRQQSPSLFSSRILNKVELDGEQISLPKLEGVIVLNIAYWGGGCRLWEGTGSELYPPASHNDSLLEVVGVYGSFHCAQIHIGLANPVRLGQAHTVRLTLKSSVMPMQVDGEPWVQGPCTILISHKTQALIVEAPASETDQFYTEPEGSRGRGASPQQS